jgi:peptide/nickel transport system substrate-binding protein
MLRLVPAYLAAMVLMAQSDGQLRMTLRSEPKTFNPLMVEDESSETIRYLTGGVLIRRNRLTQELDGELALSWRVSEQGRRIEFQLRPGVLFSDGTPFSCEDAAYTLRQLMDPALHSPAGDAFRSAPGPVEVRCSGSTTLTARFPGPVAALAGRFDQVAILSAHSPRKESAVLGSFFVREYKPGEFVQLERNPNYWKKDANGKQLPYLRSIRLDIQQNREIELLRFRRGELDVINKLDPEMYERLSAESKTVVDAGPSLDWEVVFFNQVAASPLPAYKRGWFRSTAFRRAISEAINRDDLCRIVYRGHAQPSAGPISVANRFWLNAALKPPAHSIPNALRRLEGEGFHRVGDILLDREGHRVEFSMITNAGNKRHERMLTLIQQDLAQLGIRLNVLTLDFSSIVERISRTYDYESCLMAFTNIDLDPSEQMNIWLSSAANHQWNPNQKIPQTPWEARIDELMEAQAASTDPSRRKAYFDEVQQIVADQAPIVFLVNPNVLAAVSPNLKNVAVAVVGPQVIWNAERLYLGPALMTKR